MVWSLTSQSKISFKKTLCLTDRGMATDVLVENDLKKMKKPRSVRPWCGHWWTGSKTWGKKWPGLSDSGMASGGLTVKKRLKIRVWMSSSTPQLRNWKLRNGFCSLVAKMSDFFFAARIRIHAKKGLRCSSMRNFPILQTAYDSKYLRTDFYDRAT